MKLLKFACLFSLIITLGTAAWGMGEQPIAQAANPLFITNLEASPNNIIIDDTKYRKIWDICDKYAIDLIYLEASNSLVNEQRALSRFISQTHARDIKIFLFSGRPEWSYKHIHALRVADNYVAYNEGHSKSEQLDGLLYHVRVDNLDLWTEDQDIAIKKYAQMIKKVKRKLAESGNNIPLQITVSEALKAKYKSLEEAKLITNVVLLNRYMPILTLVNGIPNMEKNKLPN